MASVVYFLCALTAILCAWLLLQAYLARGRYRLLLWSGLCFVGLAANNLLLVVDKLVLPDVDLSLWRTSVALVAMMVLLYGLVVDAE
jgi:hypothetical protein